MLTRAPERPMASDLSSRFVEYLRESKYLTVTDSHGDAGQDEADHRQAKLWELANLSTSEFADEAARFHGLERVALQEMLAAPPLVSLFSQRFLREMTVFPYRSAEGPAVFAVADPTDTAAHRAAQIVLGNGFIVKVATSEDIALTLDQRLEQDEFDPDAGLSAQPREDDIESLRDLARGG